MLSGNQSFRDQISARFNITAAQTMRRRKPEAHGVPFIIQYKARG
jgi:hypothetical protein